MTHELAVAFLYSEALSILLLSFQVIKIILSVELFEE